MIFTDIIQHHESPSSQVIHSHRLHPCEGVTVFLLLAGEKSNILSIVEDHILETISGITWDDTIENDFAYVSEHYNHFSQNLSEEDRVSIHAIFAVLQGKNLIFSHFGKTEVFLVDMHGESTLLSTAKAEIYEFQALSSGEVTP